MSRDPKYSGPRHSFNRSQSQSSTNSRPIPNFRSNPLSKLISGVVPIGAGAERKVLQSTAINLRMKDLRHEIGAEVGATARGAGIGIKKTGIGRIDIGTIDIGMIGTEKTDTEIIGIRTTDIGMTDLGTKSKETTGTTLTRDTREVTETAAIIKAGTTITMKDGNQETITRKDGVAEIGEC